MRTSTLISFSRKTPLHFVEEWLRNQWFVHTLERFTRGFQVHDANIKWVVKNRGNSISGKAVAAKISKTAVMQMVAKAIETVTAGRVKFEPRANERAANRVNLFSLAFAAV